MADHPCSPISSSRSEMSYVYVLRSDKTGKRYVGITEHPERRLFEHNSGQTPSTRSGAPWRKIHSEAHESRAAAMKLRLRAAMRELRLFAGHRSLGFSKEPPDLLVRSENRAEASRGGLCLGLEAGSAWGDRPGEHGGRRAISVE
jgi:putative endonuclease